MWVGQGGRAHLWESGGIPAVSKGELGTCLRERSFNRDEKNEVLQLSVHFSSFFIGVCWRVVVAGSPHFSEKVAY